MTSLTRTSLLLCGLTLPAVLSADWTLIDDFESYEAGGYYSISDLNPAYYGSINFSSGFYIKIIESVSGVGGDRAAYFAPSNILYDEGGGSWYQIPLSHEIGVNEVGTLYFRVWQASEEMNWVVMLSKVSADVVTVDENRWPDNAAILRYYGDETPSIDAFNGSMPVGQGYSSESPAFVPTLEAWYEYWIVVDNAFEGEVQAGGYSIYRRGPDDLGPTLLKWQLATGEVVETLNFRNQSRDSIKSLVLIQRDIQPSYLWLIDDIYLADRACLSNPTLGETCTIWTTPPVTPNEWVDTGDYLGWLLVTYSPWIYSMDLDNWFLITPGFSLAEGNGNWLFVPQPREIP